MIYKQAMSNRPIFLYSSSHDFLIENIKDHKRGFKTKLAQEIGIHKTTLSQVLKNNIILPLESSYPLSQFLGYDEEHHLALNLKVQIEHGANKKNILSLKKIYAKIKKKHKLLSVDIKAQKKLDTNVKAVYYSSISYILVRHVLALNKYVESDICLLLNLTLEQLNSIKNFLLVNELLKQSKNGRYSYANISTHLHTDDPFLKNYQKNLRYEIMNQYNLAPSECDYSYSSFSTCSNKTALKIKKLLIDQTLGVRKTMTNSKEEGLYMFSVDWIKKA